VPKRVGRASINKDICLRDDSLQARTPAKILAAANGDPVHKDNTGLPIFYVNQNIKKFNLGLNHIMVVVSKY
jgi:hypothetical protein